MPQQREIEGGEVGVGQVEGHILGGRGWEEGLGVLAWGTGKGF